MITTKFHLSFVFLVLLTLTTVDIEASSFGDVSAEVDDRLSQGRLLLEEKRFQSALDQIQQTHHWVHSEYGVNSLHQIAVLDLLTIVYRSLGQLPLADRAQEFALYIVEQSSKDASVELLQRHKILGDYYLSIGNFRKAASAYKEALVTIADREYRSFAKVEFLLAIGRTRLQQGQHLNEGINALKQAMAVLESLDMNTSMLGVVTELGLADMYTVAGETGSARHHYKLVWQALEADPAYRESIFAEPNLLFPVRYKTPFLLDNSGQQLVHLELDVNRSGRVSTFQIGQQVDSNQKREIRDWISHSIYRPRYSDGQPVKSRDLTIAKLFASSDSLR